MLLRKYHNSTKHFSCYLQMHCSSSYLFWILFKELFVKSKIGIGFIFYLVGILLVALFAVKEYRQDTSVK